MKKFLFVIVIVALLSFAACAGTERISTDAENVPADTGGVPIDTDDIPVTRGGMFCTANLPEGETLTVSVHGDAIIFDSIEQILSEMSWVDSIDVVRVEVLDERVEWEEMPYTVYRIQVLEVFQGESGVEVGDVLEIAQMGGEIDRVRLENDSFLPLAPGDDLVLFLSRSPGQGPYRRGILGFQSVFRFPPVDGMRAFRSDEDLETVYEFPEHIAYFALSLTLDDLADMQIQNFGRVSESFGAVIAELEAE